MTIHGYPQRASNVIHLDLWDSDGRFALPHRAPRSGTVRGGKKSNEKQKKRNHFGIDFSKKKRKWVVLFFQSICVDVVVFSNIAQWKPVLSVEKKHTKSLRFKKVLSALSPRSKSPPMSRAPHVVRAGGWRIKTKVIQAPKLDIDWYLYVENAWKFLNIIL